MVVADPEFPRMGRQPKMQENCRKMKKIGRGGASKFYYVDLPLHEPSTISVVHQGFVKW